MRWHVLLEIAVALVPSTLAYLASLPYGVGAFIGALIGSLFGTHVLPWGLWICAWLGSMLLSGVFALPPLWTLSIDRLHGRLTDPDMAWMQVCLAVGCALAAVHLVLGCIVVVGWTEVSMVAPASWTHVYVVAAPLALSAREVFARRVVTARIGQSAQR